LPLSRAGLTSGSQPLEFSRLQGNNPVNYLSLDVGRDAMRTSGERILTTHVGSLPRPADLHKMTAARQNGEPVHAGADRARIKEAVAGIVRKQAALGLDIVDDGEMSKPSFITYINERLSGFEADTAHVNQSPWAGSREVAAFPDFYAPQLCNVHTRHVH